MSTVTFATHTHRPNLKRIYRPGVLEGILASHRYDFDEVIIVHQRCGDAEYREVSGVRVVKSEDHPFIFDEYGVADSILCDEVTHGPDGPHYWKNHVMNHLIEFKTATSDYIVCSDDDCLIINSPEYSWVNAGIKILEQYPEVFVVCPSDGGYIADGGRLPGDVRLTENMSQQIFLGRREQLRWSNWDLPWDGTMDCAWGPFQEYYAMLEGRFWRIFRATKTWRALLPQSWRYWHYNPYSGLIDALGIQ